MDRPFPGRVPDVAAATRMADGPLTPTCTEAGSGRVGNRHEVSHLRGRGPISRSPRRGRARCATRRGAGPHLRLAAASGAVAVGELEGHHREVVAVGDDGGVDVTAIGRHRVGCAAPGRDPPSGRTGTRRCRSARRRGRPRTTRPWRRRRGRATPARRPRSRPAPRPPPPLGERLRRPLPPPPVRGPERRPDRRVVGAASPDGPRDRCGGDPHVGPIATDHDSWRQPCHRSPPTSTRCTRRRSRWPTRDQRPQLLRPLLHQRPTTAPVRSSSSPGSACTRTSGSSTPSPASAAATSSTPCACPTCWRRPHGPVGRAVPHRGGQAPRGAPCRRDAADHGRRRRPPLARAPRGRRVAACDARRRPEDPLDAQRFAQVGTWKGLGAGRRHGVSGGPRPPHRHPRPVVGHRPVGEPEPPGRAAAEPNPGHGFHWCYVPLRFDDFGLVFIAVGERRRPPHAQRRVAGVARRSTPWRRPDQLGYPRYELHYRSGTRIPTGATITATDARRHPARDRDRDAWATSPSPPAAATAPTPSGPTASGKGRGWVAGCRSYDLNDPANAMATSFGMLDHVGRAPRSTARSATACSSTPRSVATTRPASPTSALSPPYSAPLVAHPIRSCLMT